jgi:release factor glutamine methyltransferase
LLEQITNALKKAKLLLENHQVENPSLDARLLLQHSCNLTHEFIVANPFALIDTANFYQLLQRRALREPISHIIGKREFYGLDFIVTPNTLDPRADSETIIDAALAYFTDKNQKFKILDLGTGSGCLLLTLLKLYPNACGVGVDFSIQALKIAEKNAHHLNLTSRSSFVLSNWAQEVRGEFDLIISNPPYISVDDFATLAPEVRIYEPKTALVAGIDGLDCYRSIAVDLARLMRQGAYVIFECGYNQALKLGEIFSDIEVVEIKQDLGGVERVVIGRRRGG